MNIFFSKTALFPISLFLLAFSHAESVINMRALCYETKNECIRARSLMGGRSQLPIYSYVIPCVQDTISPERGRSFCASGEWRLMTQIRSSLSVESINNFLNKNKSYALRSTCTSSCWAAENIIQLLEEGADTRPWVSIDSRYAIKLNCHRMSDTETALLKNKECEDKEYLVDYLFTQNK